MLGSSHFVRVTFIRIIESFMLERDFGRLITSVNHTQLNSGQMSQCFVSWVLKTSTDGDFPYCLGNQLQCLIVL